MPLTTIEELRKHTLRTKTTTIPNLGTFRFRALSARERLDLADTIPEDSPDGLRILLKATLVNEDGSPLLTDETSCLLMDCDGEALQRLSCEIHEFLGVGDKSVEEAKKN